MILTILIILISFCLAGPVAANWPMVAADPQRTSWVSEEVGGDLYGKTEWWRPIDAFIPPHVQVIAANDLLYISTARGLYAYRYDSGVLTWKYDTAIPLGNSPTIASVNGTSMAFVGGYDKKIHAFNALTGQHLWEFSGAKAGFDANPLVINNTVYSGNRDGHFYAINAANGQLVWQYPAANQEGIGPIHLSPSYSSAYNSLYFATGYNYAYALTTSGSLLWKSPKLNGDGYDSYWPVVYHYPADGKDYVIFSGKIPYREFHRPGTRSPPYNNESYIMYDAGISIPTVSLTDAWAQGKTILNYASAQTWFQQHPEHKLFTILDGQTGQEYRQNGQPFYFTVFPDSDPINQYPPVISNDLLVVNQNSYSGVLSMRIMGWKFGTNYWATSNLSAVGDEPIVLSGGGNIIYKVLCCSRAAWYTSFPSLSGTSTLWPYGGNSLGVIAPGYDQKIYYLDPTNTRMDNITAIFGTVNGIYGFHGQQNPLVPYKGKLFTLKANALVAFGQGTKRGLLSMQSSNPTPQSVTPPSDASLTSFLESEITKIINAGILKPGYTDDSQFTANFKLLDNYFDNPGDTLITLSMAYPHLSTTLKTQLLNYINTTILPRYFSDGSWVTRIGWRDGNSRDSINYPPDLAADMQTLPDNYDWGIDEGLSWFHPYYRSNPNNLYALYTFAKKVYPNDTQKITSLYDKAYVKLTGGSICYWYDCTQLPPRATDEFLIRNPYELNAYLAGYYGFLELQQMAGQATAHASLRSNMKSVYDHLLSLRINNFSKDTPYTTDTFDSYGFGTLNISRNFIWLVPEIAQLLRTNKLTAVQQALNEYNSIGPYWFVSKFKSALAEAAQQNLYDYSSNFLARAWILQSNREALYPYFDVPAFERGDLFYIQNLVALIEAPSGGAPTATPILSSSTQSPPSPTASMVKAGDANGDNRVDGLDYVIWLNHYGGVSTGIPSGDFNSDNRVDGLDYVIWLNNYGR